MSLPSRLKALTKALEQGKELPPEVLLQLEAALDEIDKVLPPARRGRPKQRELSILPWLVRMIKGGGGYKSDRAVLQRLARGFGVSVKTLQNKLPKARKAPK